MPLLIKEQDVAKALSPKDIIEALEDGFRQHGIGMAQTRPRREVRIRGKDLPHADPRMVRVAQGLAFLEESRVVVVDHILSFPNRRTPPMRIIKYLIDADGGDVIAIIDSKHILGMRTGAAGALGAKFLSKKNSHIAGIIGAGGQGRLQLQFLCQVRPIDKAYAYDDVPQKTERFCEEMASELGITVQPLQNVEQVAQEADILVTTTPATSPIVMAKHLPSGIHVNIVGADDPPKIELEGAALREADKLVIAAEDCFKAGQMRIPIKQNILKEKDVYGTIGEIIAGIKPGRESDEEITIFHSPGVTLQDAAIAHKVYQKAKDHDLGVFVPDPFLFN